MYITSVDLDMRQDQLVQLTDDEGAGVVNEERVAAAITGAQAEVDGYCGKRYKVPFADPPQLVNRLTAVLAKYNLYTRRDEVPDSVVSQHKAAVKALDDISKGVISLGKEPEPTPAAATGGKISGPSKIFGRDKLRGF